MPNNAPIVLPPLIKGRLYGYLKVSVDEIVWGRIVPVRKESNNEVADWIVKTQWWGSDQEIVFRPLNVSSLRHVSTNIEPIDHSKESTKRFEIRTNFNLFKNYLAHCENLYFHVIEERSGEVVGTAVVTDLSKIVNDGEGDVCCYYPILNNSKCRIGDIRVCFYVKNLTSARSQQVQRKQTKEKRKEECGVHESSKPKLCVKHRDYLRVRYDDNQTRSNRLEAVNEKQSALRSIDLLTKPLSYIFGNSCDQLWKCPPNTARSSSSSGDSGNAKIEILNRLLDDAKRLRNAMLSSVIHDSEVDFSQRPYCDSDNIISNNVENYDPISTEFVIPTDLFVDSKNKDLMSSLNIEGGIGGCRGVLGQTLTDYLTGKPMIARDERTALETLRSISPVDTVLELAGVSSFTNPTDLQKESLVSNVRTAAEVNGKMTTAELNSACRQSSKENAPGSLKESCAVSTQHSTKPSTSTFGNCHLGGDSSQGDCPPKSDLRIANERIEKSSSEDLCTLSSISSTLPSSNDEEHLLASVNCYRFTVEKLVLHESGLTLNNDSSTMNRKELERSKQNKVCNNTNKNHCDNLASAILAPGRVYFIECNLNNSKRKKSPLYSAPVRFCSRKCIGNVVIFGYSSAHYITRKSTIGNSLRDGEKCNIDLDYVFENVLNVDQWRVLWRHLNQRVPSLLGKPVVSKTSACSNYHSQTTGQFERKLVLPLKTQQKITVGLLHVKLQLGKDMTLFGNFLLGNKLFLNMKNSLVNAQVQTDLEVKSKEENNSRNLHKATCRNDINADDVRLNGADGKVKRKFKAGSVTVDNYCLLENKSTDTKPAASLPSFSRPKEFCKKAQHKDESNKPPLCSLADYNTYTEYGLKVDDNPTVVSSFKSVCKETVHEVFISIINITQCSLFFHLKDTVVSYYVDYTFPFNGHTLPEVTGDFFRTYSTSTVRGDIIPKFNFEYRHKLIVRNGSSLSFSEALQSMKSSGATGVSFTVWARFYHPHPRDHKIATASLPLEELYSLERNYKCNSCYQQRADLPMVVKLPLYFVRSSITADYISQHLTNLGFLNIILNYSMETNVDGKVIIEPGSSMKTDVCADVRNCNRNEQYKVGFASNSASGCNVKQIDDFLEFDKPPFPSCNERNLCEEIGYEYSFPLDRKCSHERGDKTEAPWSKHTMLHFTNENCRKTIFTNTNAYTSDLNESLIDGKVDKCDDDSFVDTTDSNYRTDGGIESVSPMRGRGKRRNLGKAKMCSYKAVRRQTSSGVKSFAKELDTLHGVVNRLMCSQHLRNLVDMKCQYHVDKLTDEVSGDKCNRVALESVNEEVEDVPVPCRSRFVQDSASFNICDKDKGRLMLNENGLYCGDSLQKQVPASCVASVTIDSTNVAEINPSQQSIEVNTNKTKISVDETKRKSCNNIGHHELDPISESCGITRDSCKEVPVSGEKASDAFRAKIEIERALHLPMVRSDSGACESDPSQCQLVPPNTFVQISAASSNAHETVYEDLNLVTPVVFNDCNPCYSTTFEVELPRRLVNQLNVTPIENIQNLSPRITSSGSSHLNKEITQRLSANEAVVINNASSLALREKLSELDSLMENLKKNLIIGKCNVGNIN